MEDAHIACADIAACTGIELTSPMAIFGVFDGHGGKCLLFTVLYFNVTVYFEFRQRGFKICGSSFPETTGSAAEL